MNSHTIKEYKKTQRKYKIKYLSKNLTMKNKLNN